MAGLEDADDEEFRAPLPMDDRLWRHPSEVAAQERAAVTTSVSVLRTSWKQAVGLASLGAVGGALVVTGLFLTLSGDPTVADPSTPVVSAIALDPIVPVAREVDADQWPAEVAREARAGVARVKARGEDGGAVLGSAVAFQNNGLFLTSFDLVEGASSVAVTLSDGSRYDGEIVGVDSISGVAVIHIDHPDVPIPPLAVIKEPPVVGDYAVSLGGLASLDSLELSTISSTAVSVPVRADQSLHGLLQLDRGMPAGASGGAVIDDAGAVIGIIVDVDTVNATHAVPIAYARKIADDIVRYGGAKHAWLGIKGSDIEGFDTTLPESVDGGVRVNSVIHDSPADAAGLEKGDLIHSVDGAPVVSMSELILELRNHPPGDDIELMASRDGEPFLVSLSLAVRHVRGTT